MSPPPIHFFYTILCPNHPSFYCVHNDCFRDYINSNGVKVSYNTVDSYFDTLQDCYFVYKADRYNIARNEYLKLINKYYVTDFGFKYYILNNQSVELSQLLENLIFLELKRRRYKVATVRLQKKRWILSLKTERIKLNMSK